MDAATFFRRASDGFAQRTRAVGKDAWSLPTPCVDWDVRALVNHVAGEYLWVLEMLAGRTIAEVGNRLDGDVLGDEPAATVTQAQQAAAAAFERSDAMERAVHLSFGDVPAADYARQMAIDSVIHSWDLSRAIHDDKDLDPELVAMAYEDLEQSADAWRAAGAFGPVTTPVDDSLQARLLALTGR